MELTLPTTKDLGFAKIETTGWELQQTTIQVNSAVKNAIETFNNSDGLEATIQAFIDAFIGLTTDDGTIAELKAMKEQVEGKAVILWMGIRPIATTSITPDTSDGYSITFSSSILNDNANPQFILCDYANNTLELVDPITFDGKYGKANILIPKSNGDILIASIVDYEE